ncbi:MAG: S41 family peptidase [Chloroflexi bacterium]|nr:S41 family peptidase [Chloroflexota bacterium]
MWKTVKLSFAALTVVLMIVLAGVVGYAINDGEGSSTGSGSSTTIDVSGDGFSILDEIMEILDQDFVVPDAVDYDILREGAIDGAIEALGDPHTEYITPEQYELGIDIISGAFEGIGAQVDQDAVTGEIFIVAPFSNTPAAEAGLVFGDVILAVDGESAEGWSVRDAVGVIRGPQGEPVTLTIRHFDGEIEDITIVRATIVIPTVFSETIEDENGDPVNDVAYIRLEQFTDQSVGDMSAKLKEIVDAGFDSLILDVRYNPGGGLDATVQIADMFIDEGIILTQVDRDGSETVFEAHAGGEATEIPIVLLVNEFSASGSEVLAAALRDHNRATLIGEQTFGKGSVNHVRPLSDGGALYVTIARWLTPSGELIEGIGIAPDITVTFTDADVEAVRDVQLFAAINFLHDELAQVLD